MPMTKGPWTTQIGTLPIIHRRNNGGEADTFHAALRREGPPPFEFICRLDFGYGKDCDEANAQAIAALPELIEASEAVLERFLRTFDDRNSVNWFFYSEMASLRDALIKAGITT
jgi:hypothetical protein